MNFWDELWDENCLRKEVETYFGGFDESRWSLDGGISDDIAQDAQNFNRHTPGFVYQAAWNCATNLEKDKYLAIKDVALSERCKTALDYGCGIGSGLIVLGLCDVGCTGAEMNTHCIGFLRERVKKFGLANVLILDLGEEKLSHSPFDMIVCTEVFEHVENPHNLAQLLLRNCLKPGGVAILSWSFVPMVGHRPQHFYLQAPHPDQLLTMGFGKFMQDELGMKFERYTWFNNMLWRKV